MRDRPAARRGRPAPGEATISSLTITPSRYDFSPIHAAMQPYVGGGLVSGLVSVILKGSAVVIDVAEPVAA